MSLELPHWSSVIGRFIWCFHTPLPWLPSKKALKMVDETCPCSFIMYHGKCSKDSILVSVNTSELQPLGVTHSISHSHK